jgi:CRP-like cAMP-binding protein
MRCSREAAITATATTGWLAACTSAFRDWVLANLLWRKVPEGQTASHAGAEDMGLCAIGQGQLVFLTGFAMPDIGTAYVGLPGMWFGHAPLVGLPMIGSTVARVDSLVGIIRLTHLRTRLAEHPLDWQQIALTQSDIFIHAAGAHADLLMPDSRRRLAATILRLGGHRHRRYPISPPPQIALTQEELAGTSAVSRNTAGKYLRDMEDEGLIDCRYGKLRILNPTRLKAIADDA